MGAIFAATEAATGVIAALPGLARADASNGAGALLALAMACALASVGVLRLSWGRPKRSGAMNVVGWALVVIAMLVAGRAAGAWGITVAVLAATAAAFVALAADAARPMAVRRKATPRVLRRDPAAPTRPWGSRLLTFFIAGPMALATAVLCALAVRAAILAAGGAEADGNVAVLGTVPLLWPVLAFALLMMARRRSQLGWVLGLAAIAIPFVLLSGGAP